MGIRPDTYTLPPPPPVQLPTTVSSGSSQPSGEMAVTSAGPPRMEEPPHFQSKAQGSDHEEDSDGDDGKGESDSISQEDLVYVGLCFCVCSFSGSLNVHSLRHGVCEWVISCKKGGINCSTIIYLNVQGGYLFHFFGLSVFVGRFSKSIVSLHFLATEPQPLT